MTSQLVENKLALTKKAVVNNFQTLISKNTTLQHGDVNLFVKPTFIYLSLQLETECNFRKDFSEKVLRIGSGIGQIWSQVFCEWSQC